MGSYFRHDVDWAKNQEAAEFRAIFFYTLHHECSSIRTY